MFVLVPLHMDSYLAYNHLLKCIANLMVYKKISSQNFFGVTIIIMEIQENL